MHMHMITEPLEISLVIAYQPKVHKTCYLKTHKHINSFEPIIKETLENAYEIYLEENFFATVFTFCN